MSQPNFATMTDTELRSYVLQHRNNREAFHAYVDRMNNRPPLVIIEPEEWNEEKVEEILRAISQSKQHENTL